MTNNAVVREWGCEILTATTPSPTYTPLESMIEFQPVFAEVNAEDATTFADGGNQRDQKVSQRWSATASFLRPRNPTDGSLDELTAQETLRDAVREFGAANEVGVRFYDTAGGDEAWQGTARVEWEESESGVDSLRKIKVTLQGQGALAPISNPADES